MPAEGAVPRRPRTRASPITRVAFDVVNGGPTTSRDRRRYNVWDSAISTGGFATVAPDGSDSTTTIQVNPAEWKKTPAKGLMVVTFDNKSGPDEAQLIPVDVSK